VLLDPAEDVGDSVGQSVADELHEAHVVPNRSLGRQSIEVAQRGRRSAHHPRGSECPLLAEQRGTCRERPNHLSLARPAQRLVTRIDRAEHSARPPREILGDARPPRDLGDGEPGRVGPEDSTRREIRERLPLDGSTHIRPRSESPGGAATARRASASEAAGSTSPGGRSSSAMRSMMTQPCSSGLWHSAAPA
jgi:hypothetical protein